MALLRLLFLYAVSISLLNTLTTNGTTNSSLLLTLPSELQRTIFRLLPIDNAIPDLSLINHKIYREYYLSQHQIQINRIKQLYLMMNNTDEMDLTLIGNLTQHLQLNELYISHLPFLLRLIDKTYDDRTKTKISIMNAMNIKSMTIMEYNNLSFINVTSDIEFKLKLLILASRALVPIISSGELIYDNHQFDVVATGYGEFGIVWSRFPWQLVDDGDDAVIGYFGWLYQAVLDTYYKELNLPKLESIHFDDDSKQTQHLKHLIKNYGLIPWSRKAIKWMIDHKVMTLDISEFKRINALFFKANSSCEISKQLPYKREMVTKIT